VTTEHGLLPVPAPATAALLRGRPVYSRGLAVELTTPTGAAVVTTLGREFGVMRWMRIGARGCGAGWHDFPDPADVPRAALTSSDLRHRRHRTARLLTGIAALHFCAASAKPLNLSLRGPRGAEAISSHGDRHAPSALAMTNLLDLRRRRGSGFDEPACAHVTGRVVRLVQR